MRLLLFTGKGGVGKTTVAAATAVHAARSGVKTLVLSTDAAHSLGDALDVRLGARPQEVESALFAQHVQPRDRAERSWRAVQEYLVALLDAVGVDPLAAEELTVLPGAQELWALLEVRDQVSSGLWDLLIVDCAPSAETLRVLALPEVLARAVERMLPVERRVMRALAQGGRGGRAPFGRAAGASATRDHVVESAGQFAAELAGVREVLAAAGTSVRLVLTPESVVLAEARRTWTSLSLFGYTVDGVIANRLVPGDGSDEWRAAWARAQTESLAEIEASFRPMAIQRLPYAAAEPVGVHALAALARELYGDLGPASAAELTQPPRPGQPLRIEADGEEFVLTLVLPFADRRDVELARQGDELTIEVGGYRRVLALPSALRRCRVVGARLHGGSLRVRFEPDPRLWRPL